MIKSVVYRGDFCCGFFFIHSVVFLWYFCFVSLFSQCQTLIRLCLTLFWSILIHSVPFFLWYVLRCFIGLVTHRCDFVIFIVFIPFILSKCFIGCLHVYLRFDFSFIRWISYPFSVRSNSIHAFWLLKTLLLISSGCAETKFWKFFYSLRCVPSMKISVNPCFSVINDSSANRMLFK
jgi:hypothetical protein